LQNVTIIKRLETVSFHHFTQNHHHHLFITQKQTRIKVYSNQQIWRT